MFYIIINIIFVVISFSLILIGIIYKERKKSEIINKISDKIITFFNKYYKILIGLLFVLTFFTSFFKIGEVPYGMHVDEAGMAYDALSISRYGVDRYLNKFPVYLINYGGGQSAMYAYLVALLFKIFGYSISIIRMPVVIFRLLIFVCGLSIIKKEHSKIKTLVFLFLLAIVPYFIMQSRWGLDCNLLVGFLTLSLCFFVQAITKNNNILLFVSGIFFGLTLYTYALSYIIVPILLFSLCIYLLYIKKLNIKKLIILGIPVFILALPLMLMILINNGFINEIKRFITIPLLKNYRGAEVSLTNVFKNLYIIFSIFSFDKDRVLIYNSIPYFGTIYYFTIPFFIIGFIKCLINFWSSIKKKEFNISVMFVFWFFSVLICQLIIDGPNINKANAIFVPIIYFAATGITAITQKNKPLILPILLILVLNFGLFFNYYFYHYNDETKWQHLFATNYLDALKYSRNLQKDTIYIQPDLTSQEYIYTLLYNFVSPYNYTENDIETTYNNNKITYKFELPEEINSNSVYIIGNNEELLNKFEQLNFENINFGTINVFYSK